MSWLRRNWNIDAICSQMNLFSIVHQFRILAGQGDDAHELNEGKGIIYQRKIGCESGHHWEYGSLNPDMASRLVDCDLVEIRAHPSIDHDALIRLVN